jgi:hypothetical protein
MNVSNIICQIKGDNSLMHCITIIKPPLISIVAALWLIGISIAGTFTCGASKQSNDFSSCCSNEDMKEKSLDNICCGSKESTKTLSSSKGCGGAVSCGSNSGCGGSSDMSVMSQSSGCGSIGGCGGTMSKNTSAGCGGTSGCGGASSCGSVSPALLPSTYQGEGSGVRFQSPQIIADKGCGGRSLAYIASQQGIKIEEAEIVKMIHYDPAKGASMLDIVNTAKKLDWTPLDLR